jgi:hypothetical protein
MVGRGIVAGKAALQKNIALETKALDFTEPSTTA